MTISKRCARSALRWKTPISLLDAVTLARKWRPGVVLLDLMMPLGDGWEAAEAIRAIDLDLLLIAHTSCTNDEDRSRAQRTGFNGYFVKPTELENMIALMRRYFAAYEAEPEPVRQAGGSR